MNTELSAIIIGATLISVLHALIPSHWVALVVLGRNEGWSSRMTLLATAIGASLHVMSTIVLGILVGVVGITLLGGYESILAPIGASILILIGLIIILRHLSGKSPHLFLYRHAHHCEHESPTASVHNGETSERHALGDLSSLAAKRYVLALGSLLLLWFLAPELEFAAYYLVAVRSGWLGVALVSFIYFFVTVGLEMLLVFAAYGGIRKLQWSFLEKHEGLIGGGLLVLLGIVWLFIPL